MKNNIKDKDKHQRIIDLLNKTIEPSNEFTAKKIEQLRAIKLERGSLKDRLENTQADLKILEIRLIELAALNNHIIVDILEWDKDLEFKNVESKNK